MVADILFDEAVAIVATDDRVGQVHILNFGLQFAAILFGDSAAKDHGDFVGLANGAVGIQQAFSQLIQGCAPVEDEVVAVLHLGEEQPMLATRLLPLLGSKEGSQSSQPFLTTEQQIACGERIGHFL